jgi:UDP-glucose 4-epimerase
MFDDATLLITGGTGSFGQAVLSRLLGSAIKEIRILSRDEKKQDDIRKRLNDPKVKFHLGDVRDRRSVMRAMAGADYVFHAAALKQVPSCEFHPMEAVKTNVLGADNVLEAAIDLKVRKVICLSTDKAVYPVNAMGLCKALMEKVMIAKARALDGRGTTLCATRYGNVLASRGSVVPLFVEQVYSGRPITVTNPKMTRFMTTMKQAVNLVFYAFENGSNGDVFVQKAPAATVETLAHAIREICDRPDHPIEIIGTRHGEKVYETLLSSEERAHAENMGQYYRIPPDRRSLSYGMYSVDGLQPVAECEDYSSHNTVRLDVEQAKQVLLGLDFIRETLGLRAAVRPLVVR